MNKAIFISRHEPTGEQVAAAAAIGFELEYVGDVDAFDTKAVSEKIFSNPCRAVACVHPAIALIVASRCKDVILFRNRSRKNGEFELDGISVYDAVGGSVTYVDHYSVDCFVFEERVPVGCEDAIPFAPWATTDACGVVKFEYVPSQSMSIKTV